MLERQPVMAHDQRKHHILADGSDGRPAFKAKEPPAQPRPPDPCRKFTPSAVDPLTSDEAYKEPGPANGMPGLKA
jgi:hypothetical protein